MFSGTYVNLTKLYYGKISNEKLLQILNKNNCLFLFNMKYIKISNKTFDNIKYILEDYILNEIIE